MTGTILLEYIAKDEKTMREANRIANDAFDEFLAMLSERLRGVGLVSSADFHAIESMPTVSTNG